WSKAEAQSGVDSRPRPQEERVGEAGDDHVQVARRPDPFARLPFARQPEPKARVDAGGHLHLDLAPPGDDAGAPALPARLVDHLSLAAAVRAGMHVHEAAEGRLPHVPDLAPAAALRAVADQGARLRPPPLAAPAPLRPGHFDLGLQAERGLFKAELQVVAEIRPRFGTAASAALRPAAEKHVEDVVEIAETAEAPEAAEGIESPLAGSGAGPLRPVEGGVSEAIVLRPGLRVGKDPVRLADLLELGLRLGVVLVDVRVVLPGEAAVRLFDFFLGGVPGDAEHLVVVSLRHPLHP